MSRKNLFLLLFCAMLQITQVIGQTQTVLDGAYVREHNPTRKVIGYPYLREADVMWSKRVWNRSYSDGRRISLSLGAIRIGLHDESGCYSLS